MLTDCKKSDNFTNWMEQLSISYFSTISAIACATVSTPKPDVTKTDLTVEHEIITCPVSIQLKSTCNCLRKDNFLLYDLDVKTYTKLMTNRITRSYLAVLDLPEAIDPWHFQDHMKLEVYRCMYWLRIDNASPTKNKTKVRLKIPTTNIVTPEWLLGVYQEIKQENGW
jgi:hypothetical protein